MKYNLNNKVIFKISKLGFDSDFRLVYYKIEPSELSWFKRTFCNPWRTMFHAYKYYYSGHSDLFDAETYKNEVRCLSTFGEVCDYLNRQLCLEKKREVEQEQEWE